MPLIIITGVPCSGKTTRAEELRSFFENLNKQVHIVSEFQQLSKAGFDKTTCYSDKDKEKHLRGTIKSEIIKLMSPHNVVILDGLNYIKGYRYELFCAAKASKCAQCTVHTEINRDEAWNLNEQRNSPEKYDRATFDALVMRYEDPDGKNRWDAPLFTCYLNSDLNKEEIYSALFKKPLPKPNMSTQNPPLKSTNFLYELDRTTKKIADSLVVKIKNGETGRVNVPGFEEFTLDISDVSIPELMNCRRQYVNYSKSHAPDPVNIPKLFVQYLSTNFNKD
ncbi:unnamed protein product [Phyllotreta striolata]|uniref:Protein KTI12 homolog n=1 Tax=Phyllotreta striolata TaxID=444603 RepID=A0A9N9U0Y5_PHYSR|nr:unnamed protein product [Phyllotreta striolata]